MTAKVLTNIEVQGQVCVCLYGVIVFKSNVLTFHSFSYQDHSFFLIFQKVQQKLLILANLLILKRMMIEFELIKSELILQKNYVCDFSANKKAVYCQKSKNHQSMLKFSSYQYFKIPN